MSQQSYVSCIKINGVPILPPLMTDNIRSEMNYYKQLAIAVEEKLKNLHIAKQAETDKCMGDIVKECKVYDDEMLRKTDLCHFSDNDSCDAQTRSVPIETVPDIENIIDTPTKENEENIQDCKLESIDTSISESISDPTIQLIESTMNDENNHQDEELLVGSVSSDTVTASTDLNQYLDTLPSTLPTTADTTPEILKPQVPKTLNIVPITVDVPPSRENMESMYNWNLESGGDTPPKLVRQGSYILETPSPLLLAHMQTELANSNYIPTSTINGINGIKRKEWNITQAKTEWENQIRNKEFTIPDSSRSVTSHCRSRRNSTSTVTNEKICKSSAHEKIGNQLGMYQPARSVDCIQTMLAKELLRKSPNKVNNYSQRHNSVINGSVKSLSSSLKSKTNRNVSILNLANKLGGSLGSLNNIGSQPCKHVEKRQGKTNHIVASPNAKYRRDAIRNSNSPSMSVATSEKLLTIFQEIQRTHEKQMAELMDRQRKEQKNMQTEFEQQQILLLSQIKKTFPGISAPLLGETTSTADKNTKLVPNKCPLDYIYPLNGDQTTSSHSTQTSEDESFSQSNDLNSSQNGSVQRSSNDNCTKDSGQVASPAHRLSNVSRQLFPLDSKTVHIPVPYNTTYIDKHMHAATIINAYTRGYLVRRMMKTERVIALKNTYREALHCMLKLHIDAPLNLSEFNFHQRLQLQCDAASMNIVELFTQSATQRMQVIAQDREMKQCRSERPNSARSYSFATQRTLARKKLKEMGDYQTPLANKSCLTRSRCQTWTSNSREKRSQISLCQGIKRSTSAGTVRRPWR